MSLAYVCAFPTLQTKGVKSIVSIEPANAAWYAAVGAVGAAIIGTGEQAMQWLTAKKC
jgi:hypothetical protein